MNPRIVFTAHDHITALRAKELLLSNDIICMMPNELHSNLKPYLNIALSGFSLYVSEHELDKATGILEAYSFIKSKSKIEIDDLDSDIDLVCPKCGKNNIDFVVRKRRFWILVSYILTGVSLDLKKNIYQCNDCSYKWKITDHS